MKVRSWEGSRCEFRRRRIATPADAALMMQLGCEGIFVGSGIFKSADPEKRQGPSSATAYFTTPARSSKLDGGGRHPGWRRAIPETSDLPIGDGR